MKEASKLMGFRVGPEIRQRLIESFQRRSDELKVKADYYNYTLSDHIRHLLIKGIESEKINKP